MNDVNELIALFDKYSDSFGLCDHEFPGERNQGRQLEFEDEFNAAVCRIRGHEIGPHETGKPEHDLCHRCNRLVSELKTESQYKVYLECGA